MICILVSLLILFCGGFFVTVFFRKSFSYAFPFTVMCVVAVLFVSGIVDLLYVGFVALCAAAVILFSVSVFFCCRKHRLRIAIKRFFNSDFYITLGVSALFIYMIYGKLASGWDEFSHWEDIVKTMTILDAYGTDPRANSMFASYPPGMALFQYFGQKINIAVTGSGDFTEWLCNYFYLLFSFSLFLPVICETKRHRNAFVTVVGILGALLLPMIFFKNYYYETYIDPFVGVASGCGFALVMLSGRKGKFYTAYVSLLCVTLVLSKDVGLLMAVFVYIAYAADMMIIKAGSAGGLRSVFRKLYWIRMIFPVVLLAGAKLIWKLKLDISGVNISFSNPVDYLHYIKLFFLGGEESTRTVIVNNYKSYFFTHSIGPLGFSCFMYAVFFILVAIILFFLMKETDIRKKISIGAVLGSSMICYILYSLGLGALYSYRFSEYEALILASSERYLFIAILSITIPFFYLAASENIVSRYRKPVLAVICISVVILPSHIQLFDIMTRQYVYLSIGQREYYTEICSKIEKYCPTDKKTFFISQHSNNLYLLTVNFVLNPASVYTDGASFSLGKKLYDDDIHSVDITPDEWMDLLVDQYDYVALFSVDGQFITDFGVLFENPEGISNKSIYKVNKEERLLERCDVVEVE